MPEFKVEAPFVPLGDQPEAIAKLTEGIRRGDRAQVLLGATGTGKTFTMAKVIEAVEMTNTCPAIASILSLVRMIVPAGAAARAALIMSSALR